MLFGSEELKKSIKQGIEKCEQERDVKVVYAAVLGSIARGMQFADSDYDTRFLYIKKSFPDEKIRFPQKLPESELIYRMQLENIYFEQFSFWETTSFLHYLVYPSVDGKFSCGLYTVVGDTLLSPYARDPYGLQQKLAPLLKECFHRDYYLESRKQMLMHDCLGHSRVNIKVYLKQLHTALSMNYAQRYGEFSPVYLPALLQSVSGELRHQVLITLQNAQKKAKEYVKIHGTSARHDTGSFLSTERVEVIDAYINHTIKEFEKFQMRHLCQEEQAALEEQLEWGYAILEKSMKEEEPVIR